MIRHLDSHTFVRDHRENATRAGETDSFNMRQMWIDNKNDSGKQEDGSSEAVIRGATTDD